jgi:CelD/BcsL family acetyltransferase involved in cellulose biosynthesis
MEQIESHTECESLTDEWDALALETRASPFLRPGWICAWWRAFGDGPLQLLTLHRNGRLAGVLPVSSGRFARSPTNWHTPVFGPVVADREAGSLLIEALYEQQPRRIMLSFLDPAEAGLEALRTHTGRYRFTERVVTRSPCVSTDGEWEDYFAGRSTNLRKNIKRRRRYIAKQGEVEVNTYERDQDLDSLLEEAFRVESSGWKGKEGTAVGADPPTRRFYREVAHWASGAGILRLTLLRLDGQPLAFEYALVANDSYQLLKMGYDERRRDIGAGTLLTAEMVERTFRSGLGSYEFLGGSERYKLQWATGFRERIEAQAFAPTLIGLTERLIQVPGRSAARRLRGLLSR